MLKNFLVALFIGGLFSSVLAGCNTVQGFGEDLQSGGHSLAKAADKAKN